MTKAMCLNKPMFRACLGFLLMLVMESSYAAPVVLSSLRPLTLIAQEITGNVASAGTLLPVTASHHDYPLKASDYNRLQKADIVLWVGPELESFLQKPLHNLEAGNVITAYNLPGIHWPSNRNQNALHDHGQDPHLWLDPRNASVVAQALTEKLEKIDPPNSTRYRENFRLFTEKLLRLDEKLKVSLKPIKGVGFVVYHEGFGHFVSHYELQQLDYVSYTPEQKPGARHLHQLREILAKEAKCLFLEPYGDTKSARDLAREFNVRTGILDSLGNQDVQNYSQLLERMSQAFLTCLTN